MWEKWFILSVVACFTFGSVPVWADATTGSEDAFASGGAIVANDADSALDQELLWLQAELTATVEAYTNLATKTKLSADQVPGMVSVLRGKDLEAHGVRRVIDALALLPGMNNSFHNPVVRGIQEWGSGMIKILINDMPYNDSVMANGTPPYALPIEVIDRIEVIRGPGSAVYGEYAYSPIWPGFSTAHLFRDVFQ